MVKKTAPTQVFDEVGNNTPAEPVLEAPSQVPVGVTEIREARQLNLDSQATHYLVVGPELNRQREANPYRNAERVSEDKIAREFMQGDLLAMRSHETAVRTHVIRAFSLGSMNTPVTVQFVVTPHGTITGAALLSDDEASGQLKEFVQRLVDGTLAIRPKRPVKYTFEVSRAVHLATGRPAGTGVSLGPFDLNGRKHAQSQRVELVPPKFSLPRPLQLSRDRTLEQDPTRKIYYQQRVFNTDVDPADLAALGMASTRARLIRREVL